ncbi:MAG TPA: serine/threonine-protein kinase, partial [Candidatus Xenobia bacterium]
MKLPEIPPSVLGEYRILHCLGQGARGVVYEAEHLTTRKRVAIKFMGLPEDMDKDEARQRFEREAVTLSHFRHPHIVGFEGRGEIQWDGLTVPYLAMEYLPSLRTLDQAAPHYSRDWVLDRLEELLGALEYMHTHADPVVHRDLKPANLGIPDDGRLRVLDLGLARVKMSELTNQGAAMGSLGYMAPEQLMDAKKVDQRADIYSVGMIMLELLGGHPLRNMTSGRTVKAVISGHIPPTPEPIPEPLDRLARWWCALSPRERPASANAALRELRGVRQRSR